jgi:hypothetical protein
MFERDLRAGQVRFCNQVGLYVIISVDDHDSGYARCLLFAQNRCYAWSKTNLYNDKLVSE